MSCEHLLIFTIQPGEYPSSPQTHQSTPSVRMPGDPRGWSVANWAGRVPPAACAQRLGELMLRGNSIPTRYTPTQRCHKGSTRQARVQIVRTTHSLGTSARSHHTPPGARLPTARNMQTSAPPGSPSSFRARQGSKPSMGQLS